MERDEIGFKIYVESMAKSTDDKTKQILPLARKSMKSTKGYILDIGAGAGDLSLVLLNLAEEFNAGLTIVDADPRMIDILTEKFSGQPQVSIVLCDAMEMNLAKKFSTAVCSSFLHEIFSAKGEINDVKKVLKCIGLHLLNGGTLIIRDGVKPDSGQEIIYLKTLKPGVDEKLWKFAASYKYLKSAPRSLGIDGQEVIAISRGLAYEFAVKYHYVEINWPVEMKEQFGFWTEKGVRRILEETGFEAIYLKKYFLNYFKQLFSEDFELFKYENKKLIKIGYPDTHMIIAAKRI